MSKFEKLVQELLKLYRAVLNRSKHVYPVYARKARRFAEGLESYTVKEAKAIAVYIITKERLSA